MAEFGVTHREFGYAQVFLTLVFVVGYFWTLHDFIHDKVHVPAEWKDTLAALLSVLTAGVLMILNYWFQRQRESQDPGKA